MGSPVVQWLVPVTNTVKVGCLRFSSHLGHVFLSLHVASFYMVG